MKHSDIMIAFSGTEHDFNQYREGICDKECAHKLLSRNRDHNLQHFSNGGLPLIGKSPIRDSRISYYYDIRRIMRRNYSTIVKEFGYSENIDNYLKPAGLS
jgi:hypothetical protein